MNPAIHKRNFNEERVRIFVPYTQAQLAARRADRKFRSALAELNVQLWLGVYLAQDALDKIHEGSFAPALKFFNQLSLGVEFDNHSLCALLAKVKNFMLEAGEGGAPVSTSIIDLTQVLATYVDMRAEIHSTESIIRAKETAHAIALMLTEHDITGHNDEKFRCHVETCFSSFVDDLQDHFTRTATILGGKVEALQAPKSAESLATIKHIDQILSELKTTVVNSGEDSAKATKKAADKVVAAVEKGAAKVAKAVGKKRGKKSRFPIDIQEAVHSIWERESKNTEVKSMACCRSKHQHAFEHAKADFLSLGVTDVKTLKAILGARSDRISRTNRTHQYEKAKQPNCG